MPQREKTEKRGLWHIKDNCFYPFTVKPLNRMDLDEIILLQSLVLEGLGNKNWCVSLSREEYSEVLGENGITLGIKSGAKLIAFYAALFPGNLPENLGKDINLPKHELQRVCHLEIAFVHPDFRGNGLQRYLGTRLVDAVRERKEIRYLCGTVDPGNIKALNNALFLGLHIVKIKNKYGGLRRFIVYRDFSRPFYGDEINNLQVIISDINLQKKLLNEGYRGIKITGKSGKTYVSYTKEAV